MFWPTVLIFRNGSVQNIRKLIKMSIWQKILQYIIIYLYGHMYSLYVQCFCHETSDNRGRSTIHRSKHVNNPNCKFVTGIHPCIYRWRCRAQQIPIQSRIIDLSRYWGTWRRGEVKPYSFQLDNARYGIAISYFGCETVTCSAHIHLSTSGYACRLCFRLCSSCCGRYK